MYVASEMGHDQPAVDPVYARAVKRREKRSGSTLRAFDSALEWAGHTSQSAEDGRNEDGDPLTPLCQDREQGTQTG